MTEKTYKEGIYFDMPEEEYHDIPYFSRSMSENMNVDAQEAWYHSPFNPQKPENEPTAQMQLGTAVPSMLLAPEVFERLYVTRPTLDDFSGKIVLDKNAELQDFLASVGEKKTGKKEDLSSKHCVTYWKIARRHPGKGEGGNQRWCRLRRRAGRQARLGLPRQDHRYH